MGAVLRLRGHTCLHASVVAVGNVAVAFAGPSGAGKSTTAGTLGKYGFSVLADDIAVLDEIEDEVTVRPGYPRLRLGDDVIENLRPGSTEHVRVSVFTQKRYMDLPASDFHANPLPLSAVYILDKRQLGIATPQLTLLSKSKALVALVANTYGSYMLQAAQRSGEFKRLGRLASTIPVLSLERSDNLSELDQIHGLLRDDFRQRLAHI